MFVYNSAKYNSPWHLPVARIVSLLTLLAGLWILCSESHFIRNCVTTTGIVSLINRSIALSQHHPVDRYLFDYSFLVDGRTYSGYGSMDYDPGKTVTVFYNRQNPSDNSLEEPDTSIPRNMVILGGLFSFGLFPWHSLRKKHLYEQTE